MYFNKNLINLKDLNNFVRCQIRTFSDVELFETFPRKIYNNSGLTLKEAGLSKNQMLMIKLF